MVCQISFFISIMFLVGMVYFTFETSRNKTIKNYKKQLPVELQEVYDKITAERLQIYYQGYVLGLILSLIVIFSITQFLLLTFGKLSLIVFTSLNNPVTLSIIFNVDKHATLVETISVYTS